MHQSLYTAIGNIMFQYGNTALRPLSAFPSQAQHVIPTGLPELDAALGIGGIPKGRIVEIYGPDSSGKTALALHIVRQLQQQSVPSLYIDAEHGLSPMMLHDIDMLYALNVDTIEDALQACTCAAPAFGVVIIDTLAAMLTRESRDLTIGEHENRPLSKVLARHLPRLFPSLQKSGCTLILLNQIRDRVGALYGDPTTTTGGRALRYYAALRLEVRRIEYVRHNGKIAGQRVRLKITKNSYAAPYRSTDANLIYGKGFIP